MSLTIRYSLNGSVIMAGHLFRGDYPGNSTGFSTTVKNCDLFLMYLRIGFYIRGEPRSVSDVFGFIGESDRSSDLTVGFPVSSIPYDHKRDSDFYGSFYRNLQLFSSILGSGFYIPKPRREKLCRHDTFSGGLIAKQVMFPSYVESLQFHNDYYETENTHSVFYAYCVIDNVSPLRVTPVPVNTGGYYYPSVTSLLDSLKSLTVYRNMDIGGRNTSLYLSNVSYTYLPTLLRITYHMKAIDNTTSFSYEWDSLVEVPLGTPPKTITPLLGSMYGTSYVGGVSFTFRNMTTDDNSHTSEELGPTFDTYVGIGDNQSLPCIFSSLDPSATEGSDYGHNVYLQLSNRRFLDNFRDAVGRSFGHIVPSSLFSTVDAFKDAEGSLNVNILQNLQKIPDIASALPKISEAVRVMSKILKRDVSLSTLKEILDLATSTHLQASFQWRPFIQVVTEYLPKMISTMHLLGKPSKHAIGHGSFSFDLNDEFGREVVALKTRTKIVMDTSSSGLLSAILGADALGIIPKPSNIWDLVPFTFAVNWFTGIGNALRRAEISLLLMNIPAYYVHTYTITSPLTQSELDSLGSSSSSVDAACLKLFYRDVSLFTPVPRDSRFGFGMPTSLPGGILASLLYQLVLS